MYVENFINSSLKRMALNLKIGIYEEENTKGQIVRKTDITVTMKYYVDVDIKFEKAKSKNVEDYLIDREIFNMDSDYDYNYT